MRMICASLETRYSPAGNTLLPTLNANGITQDWRFITLWPNAETDANAITIAKVTVTLNNVAFILTSVYAPAVNWLTLNQTFDNAEITDGLGHGERNYYDVHIPPDGLASILLTKNGHRAATDTTRL